MDLTFAVSSEEVPTNKSSKYDDVISAIKGLQDGQHLEVKTASKKEAENASNAIRSAAKSYSMNLIITHRDNTLYIKEKKG